MIKVFLVRLDCINTDLINIKAKKNIKTCTFEPKPKTSRTAKAIDTGIFPLPWQLDLSS